MICRDKDRGRTARERRTAWLCLYAAAGKLINAASQEERNRAEIELLRHYARLEWLGVRSVEGMPVEEPL